MAGGLMRYRTLGRKSSHRKALLRNLVTSLLKHESISTTWPKAKEAQRAAEKLITLAKRNTQASWNSALGSVFEARDTMPKLFGPLRERYQSRPGGYTRVLRIEPIKEDQAPSAILELVDGPKDMRMALTARTIAFKRAQADQRGEEFEIDDMTAHNVKKVTQFRQDGTKSLETLVDKFEHLRMQGDAGVQEVSKRIVYHPNKRSR